MSDLDLDIAINLNSGEVDRSVGATSSRIGALGEQAKKQEGLLERLQRAAALFRKGMMEATLEDNIEKYNRKLQATEQQIARLNALGRSSSGGFNSLQNSINQISRELPAFTYSIQTGFMAVSNNIPMMADAVSQAVALNRQLAASGQATVPVWRQLASSLFSWQTGLSLGITLLTVYGKQIGNFIAALFRGKDAIDAAKAALSNMNEVMKNADKEAGKQIVNLNILYKAATDVTLSTKLRTAAARELQKEFPQAFSNSKILAILNGEEKKSYDELTKSILDNAKARASATKIQELAAKQLDADFQIDKIRYAKSHELSKVKGTVYQQVIGSGGTAQVGQSITVSAEEQRKAINQRAQLAIQEQEKTKAELQEQIDFLTKFAGGSNKIAEAISTGSFKAVKASDNAYLQMLSSRKGVLDKIEDIDNEYARKAFTKDEEELQALRDKFAQVRRVIEDENAKLKEYNKSHKKQIPYIDVSVIDPIEKRSEDDLKGKQAAEKEKVNIDEMKRLFTEFETFKSEYGAEAAKARYGEELKGYDSFINYLEAMISGLSGKTDAKSNALLDMYKKVQTEAQKEGKQNTAAEQLRFIKAVNDATENSTTKKREIEERYDKWQKALESNRTSYTQVEYESRLLTLKDKKAQELEENRQAAIREAAYYRDAFAIITNMSLDELKKRIKDAQKELTKSNLPDDVRKAMMAKLQNADAELNSRGYHIDQFGQTIDELNQVKRRTDVIAAASQEISSAFSSLATSLESINPDLADTLSTMSELAGVAGNAAKAVGGFASGDIISGITGVIGAVAGVFSIFGKAKESARKAAAEMKAYQDSLIVGEIQYNALLRERARSQADIAKLTTDELNARQKMLEMQKQQALADYNRLLGKIQTEGKQVTGQHTEKYGGFLGIGKKTRVVQELAGLNNADYDELERLYNEGKMTDATKEWFENLKKVKEEMDAIGISAEDTLDQLNQVATGTTASSIAQGIIDGFKAGKRTAADFADYFKQLMQNAALSIFQANYLNGKIDEWYKKFAAAGSDGVLTDAELAVLRTDYANMIEEASKEFDNLEKVVGSFSGTDDANSLQGAYKTASQESIDLLSANTGGLRIAAVEGNTLAKIGNATMADSLAEIKVQTLSLKEIENNTKIIAENSEYLENLEEMNRKMDDYKAYRDGTGRQW